MSLDDKFYLDDGSSLNRFDNFMIKSAGKIGEAYQQITGESYKDLVDANFQASRMGFGLSVLGLNPAGIFWGYKSHLRVQNPSYKSPLEEEIFYEAIGKQKKSGKIL